MSIFKKSITLLTVGASFFLSVVSAEATCLQYVYEGDYANNGSLTHMSIGRTTGNGTDSLNMYYNIDPAQSNGQISDNFSLVLSGGDNPSAANQYTILYGDLKNNTISAYVYDPVKGIGSYQDQSNAIGKYSNVFSTSIGADGTQGVEFNLDIATLNQYMAGSDWQGIDFTDEVGIWFQAGYSGNQNGAFTYDVSGNILSYDPQTIAWVDQNNQGTQKSVVDCNQGGCFTPTPIQFTPPTHASEPSALALVGLGLWVVSRRLRRK